VAVKSDAFAVAPVLLPLAQMAANTIKGNNIVFAAI